MARSTLPSPRRYCGTGTSPKRHEQSRHPSGNTVIDDFAPGAERSGWGHPKTVAKWRKCTSPEDRPMGPKTPHSTVLSADEEALIVAFRQHTLLPLGVHPHRSCGSLDRRRQALLFVAVDRVSKFAFAEVHERATRRVYRGLLTPAGGTRAVPSFAPCSRTTAVNSRRRMAAGASSRFGPCSHVSLPCPRV